MMPRPFPFAAAWALLLLSAAAGATALGRAILALLVGPIQTGLGLGDAQVGLLFGVAYMVAYALVSFPVARLIDGGGRRTILGLGLALWSLATAAGAFASGFWSLLLARIGTVGETAIGPASFSMLADNHRRERLALAIATVTLGALVGGGLALAAGGLVVDRLGWRWALLLSGMPGLVVAALVFTLAEPARRETDPAIPSTDEAARHVIANGRAYAPILAAVTLLAMLSGGLTAWTPTVAMRAFGWSATECGLVLGMTLLTAGPLGALFGGRLATRLAVRGRADAEMRVVLWSALVSVPAAILFPLMRDPELWTALHALFWFAASWALGPQIAALQLLAPNRMRARVTALALFLFNVLGQGLGPMIVPLLASGDDLGPAMALLTAIAGPIAILAAWLSLKPYAQRMAATA